MESKASRRKVALITDGSRGIGAATALLAAAQGWDVLTLGLAKEVAAEGIRVNAVRPGLIETDIHASGGQPDRVQRLAPHIPMQRGGTAQEVADAIVWLMGDGSHYTTGSLIEISGGNL